MPNVHTHYDNLKVARSAPIEVIEAAYRSLAQKYHPERDPSPNAARVMALVSHAYSVLATPNLRREHDEWIRQAEAGDSAGSSPEAEIMLRSKRARWVSRQIFTALLIGLAIGVGISGLWQSTRTTLSVAPPVSKSYPSESIPGPTQAATSANVAAEIAAPSLSNTGVTDKSTSWVVDGPDVPISQLLGRKARPTEHSAVQCPPRFPMPETGVAWSAVADSDDWPQLKITTGENTGNAYAKVIKTDGTDIAHLFVRRRESATISLPPGDYKIRYVSGSGWYGDQFLFCPQLTAMEGQGIIKLRVSDKPNGRALLGQEIELIPQIGGNFETHPIPLSQF
jgi:hypothetical protein